MKRLAVRKVSAAVLTAVIMFTAVFSLSTFAKAASFTPRLEAPSYSNKYFYDGNYNIYQSAGYGIPNCTAYAYGRAYEILGKEPKLSWYSAETWFGYNLSGGYYDYGYTPKLGAIACWEYGYGGHVAVVEQINADGSMILSNSEWGGREFYLTYANVNDSNPGGNSWWNFQGYIYIIDSDGADVVAPSKKEYKTGVYQVDVDSILNMRSKAGTGSSVSAMIPDGVKLSVTKIEEKDGYTWGYTTYKDKNGWVALNFCEYLSELPAPETQAPTTVAPTTEQPATVAPTTAAPTTEEPTTVAPVTEQPTTVAPTTVAPTEQPTTVAPTEPVSTLPEKKISDVQLVAPGKGRGIGDVNSDGMINVSDATIIQKYLSAMVTFTSEQISWADFNFDGNVTIEDVTSMQKHISLGIFK